MEIEEVFLVPIVRTVTTIVLEVLSDDEDEGVNILEKNEHFAEITVPNFNNRQFKEHFRMWPETFEILLQQIHESVERLHDIHRGQPELPLEKHTLMTLWCLSNVESFRSVGDRFGVSKSACWRILYRTCNRILSVNRVKNIISFPTAEEADEIMRNFELICGFPRILGAIDGCHIRIEKPPEFPNSYINRKGFPSVILQGICDTTKRFRDVYVGQPGSLHDARVFSRSDIHARIRTDSVEFPDDGHLIGDLAYPLSTKLLVGFKDQGHLTDPQKLFNRKLSQSRVVIENAFGLLKCRFRRLKMIETKRLDLVCLLVVSACILHNVCISNGDDFEGGINDENVVHDEEVDGNIQGAQAIIKRNDIMNYLYNLEHQM